MQFTDKDLNTLIPEKIFDSKNVASSYVFGWNKCVQEISTRLKDLISSKK